MNLRRFLVLALLLVPLALEAHVRLLVPHPRSNEAGKVAPCGGYPRKGEPLVLVAGQELEVTRDEYIQHPGYYRILFSTGGDRDFIVLLDRIPDRGHDPGTPSAFYSAKVVLPSIPCEACTLLLIQVMTENPQVPSLYYSCADIRLVAEAPHLFIRGDSNQDGTVDLTDAVSTFGALFLGDEGPACPSAADSNDDGSVDLSDGIFILIWLFGGGPAPAAPFAGGCGPDSTTDALGCTAYPPCE